MAAIMKAVVTSNTECCLINMVDIIIDVLSIKEANLIPLCCLKCLLLIIAMWQPSELYTWILGHRLVGVSVEYNLAIKWVKTLALGKTKCLNR